MYQIEKNTTEISVKHIMYDGETIIGESLNNTP